MYNFLHDILKTILLAALVVYAALNYYEKHLKPITISEYEQSLNDYYTHQTYDAIVNYFNDEATSQYYFDDSHPII